MARSPLTLAALATSAVAGLDVTTASRHGSGSDFEQAALAKLAVARKEAAAEKGFLVDFVTKSRANVDALQALLTKLNTPPPPPPPVAAAR